MKHNGMIVRSLITFFGLCSGFAYCESNRENDQFHNQIGRFAAASVDCAFAGYGPVTLAFLQAICGSRLATN